MTDVQNMKSNLTYNDLVIEKIVGHALENVDGLLAVNGGFFSNLKNNLVNSDSVTDGVNVEVGSEEVAVDLNVIVEYGKDIPAIVESMKGIVAQNVEVMTHLKVIELNVNVVDIQTKEEFEKSSVTVQDRLTDAAQATGEFASQSAEKIKEAAATGAEKTKEFVAQHSEKE
ncbi:Asp23/Gls24 family envelope stress response protein [Streptococcus gallinaceus]|uniref:Stress response regulator gls24 homolog n=1 Tax=Streptococcus gallinaceus TaxID=165758 RepID=A0ABV2JMA6_9STRE